MLRGPNGEGEHGALWQEAEWREGDGEWEEGVGGLFINTVEAPRRRNNCIVSRTGDKIVVNVGIDSCAAASGANSVHECETVQDDPDRTYESTSDHRLKDHGHKVLAGRANGRGDILKVKCRAAPVCKTLLCASELVDQVVRVVFDRDIAGNDISHMIAKKTGHMVKAMRQDKVYSFPTHLESGAASAGFTRPGARRL